MPLMHYLCVAKVGLVLVSLPSKIQYLVMMPELIWAPDMRWLLHVCSR